mgnify:CR=1 FL=1
MLYRAGHEIFKLQQAQVNQTTASGRERRGGRGEEGEERRYLFNNNSSPLAWQRTEKFRKGELGLGVVARVSFI